MLNAKMIGDRGEECAAEYMTQHGFEILGTNYSSPFGEIDIIAKKDEYIIFTEVKSRKNSDFGEAREFVNFQKQKKIIKTAEKFLSDKKLDCPIRFDVCEIYHSTKDNYEVKSINYIEGAFEYYG